MKSPGTIKELEQVLMKILRTEGSDVGFTDVYQRDRCIWIETEQTSFALMTFHNFNDNREGAREHEARRA